MKHVIKFTSFLNKNNDITFIVKRRIFEAAVMSGVLYGCEAWLNADLRPIAKVYNWALKSLLSFRESIVGTVAFTVTLCIHQGSLTSCILFIIYVNDMIKLIKENCDSDGFLSWPYNLR